MISFAQNFEDVILWRALKNISSGFYIDIGAQDPIVDSVSRSFHEKGWTGVHVEPSPYYAEKLRLDRPNDEVLQSVIGRTEGVSKFFLFPDTGLSTGLEDIARQHVARGFRMEEVEAPIQTTAQLLDRYADRDIHWMKIDCEGMEAEVIEGWGASPVRPWILVIESVLPSTQTPSHEAWEASVLGLGYDYVYSDGLNRFYVSHQHPELKDTFGPGANCFDGFGLAPFHLVFRNIEREIAAQSGVLSSVREQLSQDLSKVDTLTHERRVVLAGLDERLGQGVRLIEGLPALISKGAGEMASEVAGEIAANAQRQLEALGALTQQRAADIKAAQSAQAAQTRALAQAERAHAKMVEAQDGRIAALEGRIQDLSSALQSERSAADAHDQLLRKLESQLAETAAQNAQLRGELAVGRNELTEWRTTADHWRHESRALKESTSWRVTAPIRWFKTGVSLLLRAPPKVDPISAPGSAEPAPPTGPGQGLRHWVGGAEAVTSSPVLERANAHFEALKTPGKAASASGAGKK
jgi:FkbM family methyltransferase